jgi:hypothetical protein
MLEHAEADGDMPFVVHNTNTPASLPTRCLSATGLDDL